MSGAAEDASRDSVCEFLLGATSDAVLITDGSGRLQRANDFAVELFGLDRDRLHSMHISGVLPAFSAEAMDRHSNERLGRLIDAECRGSDQVEFPVEVVVRRAGAAGELLCFQVRDRRHHRRAEDDLKVAQARIARAERLETAGTIAGQIAHDFNNLLTPLLAYPSLIRKDLAPDCRGRQYLDVIEKTSQDMSRLTQQLLSLSRRGHVGQELCNINDVVEQVVSLIQSMLPKGVTVEFDLAEDLLCIKGGKVQIVRVLENLCQNAIDAMGESGVLRLTTENVYLDAPVGQYDSVKVGEYVRVSVVDTGTGIPSEIRDKVFDPFFTTKKASKQRGSGLGLSIVHGIVKDHDGYIDLDSTVGKGTTFSLYFPICRKVVPAETLPTIRGGSESILVVDDDLPQIQVMEHLLGSLGYKVTGAQGGDEALKIYQEAKAGIDLVILDMVMDPGIDGLEVFKRIRKINPNQRVMLVSGFEKAKAKVVAAQGLGAGSYVKKPLTIEKIGPAVRQELDAQFPEPVSGTGQKVLIVDDEEPIRKLFQMILASELPRIQIDFAANGQEAVEVFRKGHHSLLVMDLYMPVMDGRQAFGEIESICRRNQWRMPSVVFCTGFALPESLHRIIADGRVHCLLRKPIRAEVLVRAVKERLK